jgi:hypothetical protein
MSDNHDTACERDALLEDFAAELTEAAFAVALRHGMGDRWLDLELELWKALKEKVNKVGRWLPPGSEAAFVCDWAERQYDAVHGDFRDGLGHWRDVSESLSGA